MALNLLTDKGDCIIDRNFTKALNQVKKALDNGEDREVYDILKTILNEIEPYILREYPE